MEKLIFATNNEHKLRELREILSGEFEILSLQEIGCFEDIPETGDTIEENASIKSHWVYSRYKTNCFSDDTGLEIDALGGRPGVKSARYAGEGRNASDNVAKVLSELEGVSNRTAQFKTVISLILDGREWQFEGVVKGTILTQQSGSGGFGYDPVFLPEGFTESFAVMSPEQKNKISHRGEAVRKLVSFLKNSSATI